MLEPENERILELERHLKELREDRDLLIAWLKRQGGRSAWTLVPAIEKGEHRWGAFRP